MSMAPAIQAKRQIVEFLRLNAGGFSLPIPSEQIRAVLDVTAPDRDAYGIVVGCEDLGDHDGWNTGRVLVDVRPSVTIYTHIDEDADGTLCDALASDALALMPSMQYTFDGWLCHYGGNWTAGDVQMDGAYRTIQLAATLPLERISP